MHSLSRLCSILLYLTNQSLYGRFQVGVRLHSIFDSLAGVHDRGVVPAAKLEANFGGGKFSDFPGDVHGDLPWKGDCLGSLFSPKLERGKVKIFGYRFLDDFNGDITLFWIGKNVL